MPAASTIALWQSLSAVGGRSLDAGQCSSLERYLDLLLEANRRVNLTRIRDRATAEIEHVADALTLLRYLPAAPSGVADLGSGGGVPGIVLAIARPDCRVTLIESIGKKAAFLRRVCDDLHLANASVLAERAETVGRGVHRETFEVVTARAVADLALLLEWSMPLVRVGGRLLAMKGPRVATELSACASLLQPLGASALRLHRVDVVELSGRCIVEVAKIGSTDSRYPPDPTRAGRRRR